MIVYHLPVLRRVLFLLPLRKLAEKRQIHQRGQFLKRLEATNQSGDVFSIFVRLSYYCYKFWYADFRVCTLDWLGERHRKGQTHREELHEEQDLDYRSRAAVVSSP